MRIRPFQSWSAHITITQAKELLKSIGKFGPFRECGIKSITAGIFLNLCCCGYWKESFTVQGFTEDNLICKRLLCYEQIKMTLAKAMPRALREGMELGLAPGFFRYTCAVTNISAPGSPPALYWVYLLSLVLLQRGKSVCLHYKQVWVWSMHGHTWASTYRKKDLVVITVGKKATEKCNS